MDRVSTFGRLYPEVQRFYAVLGRLALSMGGDHDVAACGGFCLHLMLEDQYGGSWLRPSDVDIFMTFRLEGEQLAELLAQFRNGGGRVWDVSPQFEFDPDDPDDDDVNGMYDFANGRVQAIRNIQIYLDRGLPAPDNIAKMQLVTLEDQVRVDARNRGRPFWTEVIAGFDISVCKIALVDAAGRLEALDQSVLDDVSARSFRFRFRPGTSPDRDLFRMRKYSNKGFALRMLEFHGALGGILLTGVSFLGAPVGNADVAVVESDE